MAQSYQSYQDAAEARSREGQDALKQVRQKAGEAADTLATEGGKAMRAAGEAAEDAFAATRRFVREQPLVALGAAAVFACAVGALWKLSTRRDTDLLSRVSGAGSDLKDRLTDYVEPGYRALRRRF